MAAFMEVLDTSIANVALPHLAGDLGASNDESTWVLTSYLVSNAIVLPIGGWLATSFGRKRFFHAVHRAVHRDVPALRNCPQPSARWWCFALSRVLVAAACSRWRRRFWPIPFHRKKGGLHLRSTA